MKPLEDSGIYELFIPGLGTGELYKFAITTQEGKILYKADPFAFSAEFRPGTASVTTDITGFHWDDEKWIQARKQSVPEKSPMAIYEVHLGSWKKADRAEKEGYYTYKEAAHELADYVKKMGYTHVELMGIAEHPYDGSWGYQVTGYYAPTSRYGTPKDFMYFVNYLHKKGIGVILDWVPAHFPRDTYGLSNFDGTCLYEHLDPRQGSHPHWGTLIYNYGRPQVSNYLIANALFWVEKYHADGIRMDAVASMLYLDYGKKDGEWVANMYGGKENLEAIELIKHLNSIMKKRNPGVLTIAEESTAFPKITGELDDDGLGFDLKWNMGFMNDYLDYIKFDPYFRSHRHGELTFSMVYAYSEKFILVFSHDEVVHGKASLIGKMPGDRAQKFANLRLTFAYMMTHPGKKLTFMGAELAQWNEWHYEYSLDWHLLQYAPHRQTQEFFKAMNNFYLEQPPLWDQDDSWQGFQWLCADDNQANTVAFLRWDRTGTPLIVLCNFSPEHRKGYRVGAPFGGAWAAVFNTDDEAFGGQGLGDKSPVKTEKIPCHDQQQSLEIDLPPMSTVIYRCTRKNPVRKPKEQGGKTVAKAKAPAKKAKTAAKPKKVSAKAEKATPAGQTESVPAAPVKKASKAKKAPK